ncbi:MAG: HD domain-containing protein [Alphaproteobacteria bacterium]|nr:HD domain-containing protein [Alphaproteobacteria bacterium]
MDEYPLFADELDGSSAARHGDGEPWTALVVDDEESMHEVTRLVTDRLVFRGRPIRLLSARSAAEARALVEREPDIAVVLLDVVMETDTAGLDFVRWLRAERHLADPRIIIRTGQPGNAPERGVMEQFDINYYRTKTELTADRLVSTLVVALRSFDEVVSVRRLADTLERNQRATVFALAELAEHRDTDTGAHIHRVRTAAEGLARELLARGVYADELHAELVETIGLAATLHDVGKVAIPDTILHKPGKLNPEEWIVMKSHAVVGGGLLERAAASTGSGYMLTAAQIAHHHHERWDGHGYPAGLSGRDIPLPARIAAVVDVFDALVSPRPYKAAWPVAAAAAYVRDNAGSHFDPQVADAFLSVIPRLEDQP